MRSMRCSPRTSRSPRARPTPTSCPTPPWWAEEPQERGLGLPGTRGYSGTPPRTPGAAMKFFISYRRDDSIVHARLIHNELAARFGADDVFMDIDDIEAGDD